MQRECWKVFWACAIGAGIGSLVALEISPSFWWTGLLIGGLVGYLSYEWRPVLRAFPAAYRAARGWKPLPQSFPAAVWGLLNALCTAFWISVGVECYLLLLLVVAHSPQPIIPWRVFLVLVIVLVGSLAIGLIWGLAEGVVCILENDSSRLAHRKEICRGKVYRTAPPLILFWHLPRGILYLIRFLPRGSVSFFQFCRQFGWQLFLRIHSEVRVLCGIDAMLGTAIGYFAGSAIIGALAGGVFGVLNYLFVTELWLKRRGYLPLKAS